MDFDATSPNTLADPHGIYRQLRAEQPVHWSEPMQSWVFSRYVHVRDLLNDPRCSARHTVQQLGAGSSVDMGLFGRIPSLPTTDPPTHTRLRMLVNRAFTPGAVNQMRQTAEQIVDLAVKAGREKGQLDVGVDLAGPLPSQIIAAMLSVPIDDWQLFKRWSDDLFGAFKGPLASETELAAATDGARQLEAYFRQIVRATDPDSPGLISRIKFAVGDEGEHLTEDEVVTTCIILLVGGNETTTGLILNGFAALAARPDLVTRLRNDPSLVGSVVEEFLRLWGPVHLIARRAFEDIPIAGAHVRKGDSILLVTASANRDGDQFSDPDTVLLGRQPNDHLAFGRGRHFCLGAPLARLEARLAFQGVIDAFGEIVTLPDHSPKWIGPLTARHIDEVSLVSTACQAQVTDFV